MFYNHNLSLRIDEKYHTPRTPHGVKELRKQLN